MLDDESLAVADSCGDGVGGHNDHGRSRRWDLSGFERERPVRNAVAAARKAAKGLQRLHNPKVVGPLLEDEALRLFEQDDLVFLPQEELRRRLRRLG